MWCDLLWDKPVDVAELRRPIQGGPQNIWRYGHPPLGTDRALRRDLTTDAAINTATAPSDAMNPTDPGSAIESPRATNATLPGTMPIAVPMA